MILTPEDHLALGIINPELDEILKANGPLASITASTDILKLRADILERKRNMTDLSTEPSSEEVSYVEEDRQIPVRDGSTIPVRIHKPMVPPTDGSPIFVVYHGGGFCLGGLDNEVLLCRNFTTLGGIAVNVDYRLAPENPFPVPINDAYDAFKWVAMNFIELGGNIEKGFLVGGVSAGANFSTIIPHLYRDENLEPKLTGVFLSIPPAMPEELCPEKYKHVFLSREQNKDAPVLNEASIELFERLYKPDFTSPLYFPMLFKSHKDLPPTYFQICGLDPLRDEAMIYEEVLKAENGIETRIDLYPGLPHGFWSFWPKARFSEPWQGDCIKGLEWLLKRR